MKYAILLCIGMIIGATITHIGARQPEVATMQEFEVLCDDGYRRYTADHRFTIEQEKAMCDVVFP